MGSSNDKTNKMIINLYKNSEYKNLMYMPNIGVIKKLTLLIPNAKKTFNHLNQMFIKALILQYFDSKSHIWIETNISNYVISKMLNQLNLNSHALLNN